MGIERQEEEEGKKKRGWEDRMGGWEDGEMGKWEDGGKRGWN